MSILLVVATEYSELPTQKGLMAMRVELQEAGED